MSENDPTASPTPTDAAEDVHHLFGRAYAELRSLAHSKLRGVAPITALNTTSLVHECYLRLAKLEEFRSKDRAYLMCYAARTMRSIVVDLLRQRRAERHGGDHQRVSLDSASTDPEFAVADDLWRINDAIKQLETVDSRLAQVVELKYFGGLSYEDIAVAMGVTERTVRRDWDKARLWLHAALEG
jgi:RNA polymerase sigma factor (TIGR02999 family)